MMRSFLTTENRFYERQGFVVVDDFSLTRANKPAWAGTLMRMNLSA